MRQQQMETALQRLAEARRAELNAEAAYRSSENSDALGMADKIALARSRYYDARRTKRQLEEEVFDNDTFGIFRR